MNDANDRERLFVARCSFVLFIVGLLVPFIIIAVGAGVLAVGFCFIAEVLALIFGIVGRRHLSGRIGMIGSIFGVVLALALSLAIPLREARISAPVPIDSDGSTATISTSAPIHSPKAATK